VSISLIVNTYPKLEIAHPTRVALKGQTDTDFEIILANSQEEYPKLASKASHNYLVFLGARCIPKHTFIAAHRAFAKQGVSSWCNRVVLDQTITQHLLDNQLQPELWNAFDLLKLRISGHVDAVFPRAKHPRRSEFATFGVHKVDFGLRSPQRRLPYRGTVFQLASVDYSD
jgi:hypothetical protein